MAQLGDVLYLALAVGDPFKDLQHALGALTARNALAAGFVLGEPEEKLGEVHHAGARVGHHQAARAHHAAQELQAFVVDGRVHPVGRDASPRWTSGLRSLDGRAIGRPTANVIQNLAHGDAHRHFDETGVLDLAREREDLRTCIPLRADAAEPRHPLGHDQRYVGEGFDVVHAGRVSVEAMLGRIGRLVAGHAALAFDAGDHRRLFATHEGASALHDLDVQILAGAENVGTD